MKTISELNIGKPIIFVNPYFNKDFTLIAKVNQAGGIGVIDHVTAGPARFEPDDSTPYGIRVHVDDPLLEGSNKRIKLGIIPLEDNDRLVSLEDSFFLKLSIPVFVEVGCLSDVSNAQRIGAAGLIVRGSEGPGWVSPTHGFVLLQQIIQMANLPVFHQGGIGPYTSAGAIGAGASGIVSDYHLLLTDESAIDSELKTFLSSINLPGSTILNEISGHPFRSYSRIGTKKIRELKKMEESLAVDESKQYQKLISSQIGYPSAKPDGDDSIFPFSEDLTINRVLLQKCHSVSEVIAAFDSAMKLCSGAWPFKEGSPLSVEHGVRFPVVQGPMAHVSDNSGFSESGK